MECYEGHKNCHRMGHDSYGRNICQECWQNHGWVTHLTDEQLEEYERERYIELSSNRKTEASEAFNLGAIPSSSSCKVPPAGWLCSRKCGHSGPCAASPSWWNRIVIWVKNFWS